MELETVKEKTINNIYIVTGGVLTPELLNYIDNKHGIIIGVDKGSEWLIENNLIPDYFVGDFDSVNNGFVDAIKGNYSNRIYLSPIEKDETDTELAMRLAISLNPKQITILGGIGTRLDHVIANVHILLQAEKKAITACMIDLNNKVQLLLPEQKKRIDKSTYKYVSLIPLTERVEGIKLEGYKYPLKNAAMEIGKPYGISNEIIKKSGTISIDKGILIVIESKD